MTGLYRAASKVAVLLSFLLLVALPSFAADTQVSPDCATVGFTGSAIAASGSETSSAFVQLGKAKDVSLQIKGTGTSPNYTVSIEVTLDGTNYVAPETGATLGTFTDQLWHVVIVSPPFCKGIKVKVLNNNGSNSLTPSGTICSQ